MGYNIYGDQRVLAGDGAHGVDVASQRADALDEMALADIVARIAGGKRPTAVDLGCGAGGQVGRMERAGARVVAVDMADTFAQVRAAAPGAGFVRLDLRALAASAPTLPWAPFDVVICQRALHYLPHADAAAMLVALRSRYVASGSSLYVSASGMGSELAEGYPHAAYPPAQRFAPLAPDMAARHGILAPVCLYSPLELADMVSAAGFRILKMEASAFGNAKVAAIVD